MRRNILFGSCLALSMTGHLFVFSFSRLGPLEFGAPVRMKEMLTVDLHDPPPSQTRVKPAPSPTPPLPEPAPERGEDAPVDAPPAPVPGMAEPAALAALPAFPSSDPAGERPLRPARRAAFVPDPSVRSSRDFLVNQREKLVYRINLRGLPVGAAELQASNETGDVRISLRIRSDESLSAIYPVDVLIETRHINGNFILSRIRQREGSFRSDRGFTIFLRDRHVFWIDRMTNRSTREQIPNSEVVDMLSGLYYLRNRPLRVGSEETLHLYDSETYAPVQVGVLRSEAVSLPAFREVDALLIQPRLKTGGLFRFTGDLHIWLSNDRYRVPVKMATTIPLGQITAELVSSENGTGKTLTTWSPPSQTPSSTERSPQHRD